MDDPLFARTAVDADEIQVADLEPLQPDPEAIIDLLLDCEDVLIVGDALFASVVALLTRRRDISLNAQGTNIAEKCDDIFLALRRMQFDSIRQAALDNCQVTMGRHFKAARLSSIDLEARYRRPVDRVVEENRDHVTKPKERHREEREAFKAKRAWQTSQRTRLFSKVSPALINLWGQNYMLL
jgi:hypothetical protein